MAISMENIAKIKELQGLGYGSYQISGQVATDPKTVRKYMKQVDFSPKMPAKRQAKSKLEPWIPTIQSWLEEDLLNRKKQRHTAKRVQERLAELSDYDCSYRTACRYVALWKDARQQGNGCQELVWHMGEAQGDFGECDLFLDGMKVAVKYFVLTFPHANVGFLQIFQGETAECLCQGLKNIFHHIGGVPIRIVIDNATGAGRRMGEVVRLTELFKKFQIHYGFEVTFCNPQSGNEKGNVENKVGYLRRNLLVPIPSITSIDDFNIQML